MPNLSESNTNAASDKSTSPINPPETKRKYRIITTTGAITLGCFLLVAGCIVWIALDDNLDAQSSTLISIILTLLSAGASWLLSAHYSLRSSRIENRRTLDEIAERSSEKLLNQSFQLYGIEQYLEEKRKEIVGKYPDEIATTYLESTRNLLTLIRSSNNTYLKDWQGVASEQMKSKLSDWSEAQTSIFNDLGLVGESSPEQQQELEEKIEANSRKLPSHLVPKASALRGNHAQIINHVVTHSADGHQKGVLTVLVSNESARGHVVGKFQDKFSEPPGHGVARVIVHPNPPNSDISVAARNGTTHDFHVLFRNDSDQVLAKGEYQIEYEFGNN